MLGGLIEGPALVHPGVGPPPAREAMARPASAVRTPLSAALAENVMVIVEPFDITNLKTLQERIKQGGVITITRGTFGDAVAHQAPSVLASAAAIR